MALAPDVLKRVSRGGRHRIVIPISTTGIFVFPVSPGRRISVSVENPGGSTFDLIHFNFSEKDDTDDAVTRVKAVDELAVTSLNFTRASFVGMFEVGIEITTATASTVTLEVLESKV